MGFLTTPAAIGNLAIGAERTLDLLLAPTDSVPEGIHELAIRVRADNHASRDIPVYAYITRSGIGSVLFHVSDIYTATLDGAGNPIPGLQNAVVRIQNEKVPTIEQTANTDDNGELLFENLAAGSYLFRVSAPDHEAVFGRFTIQPGVTLAREVFLDYDLITIEWEVVEIPLEDRYEIILTAIYETDVPAPVVLIEPPGITLPTMAPGEIYQGELTITNYGLIRADDLVFTPAPDDEYFDYEFMAEIPESLGAKERVTVPYRIVALRSLTGSGAQEDTGGGDCGYGSNAHLTYRYICANGTRSGGGSGFGISANVSSSCGGPGGGVGPPPGGGSGSGGGGGYGGGSPTSVIPCPPDCEGECCSSYGGGPGAGGASPSPPTGGSY